MSKLHYKTSQIKDGNMSFRYGEQEDVINNRENFLKPLNIETKNLVVMNVEMKDRITVIGEKEQGLGALEIESAIRTDALITKDKHIPLFLMIADCLPIIIHDPIQEVLALIHSGWPNTDFKISQKVITKMIRDFGSKVEDLEIYIGPGIQKDSLIYDNNIFNLITSDWGKYIENIDGKYHIDNLGYTLEQIRELGIQDKQIEVDSTDTCTSEEYFSHVRDHNLKQKDKGRFVTVAYITD